MKAKELKSWYEISNGKNKVLVKFYSFFYSKNDGVLGGPDWVSCKSSSAKMESWALEMKRAFKN